MSHYSQQLNATVNKMDLNKEMKSDKNIPKGWYATYIGHDEHSIALSWDKEDLSKLDSIEDANYCLRVTNAVDYRDEQCIEVRLTLSQELVGKIDIRYSYTYQFFDLLLDKSMAKRVINEGIVLSCPGKLQQLWIFDDQNTGIDRQYFVPHLLVTSKSVNRIENAIFSLLSFKSIQPFGWIEGSVLDGIQSFMNGKYAKQAKIALEKHIAQYVTSDGKLIYEDLHGNVVEDAFTTIEATLPMAIIAKYNPNHVLIENAVSFFTQRNQYSDLIIDDHMVSAEGCYTVAYPLAVMACATQNSTLAELSVKQILLRKKLLTNENDVYLRYLLDTKTHTFKNWSRAFGWYYLGMVKTYCTLQLSPFNEIEGLDDMRLEIKRISELVLTYKQNHGLWNVFLDLSDTDVETSGSSAIAAAMAMAAKHNIISENYLKEAESCYFALVKYISVDGLLSGVSQHNAGGMRLQLSQYRVLSQMGLGLWGQLHNALHNID